MKEGWGVLKFSCLIRTSFPSMFSTHGLLYNSWLKGRDIFFFLSRVENRVIEEMMFSPV